MNIKSAAFVKGVIGSNEILVNGKFQVAFLGRSNVGKSTLINSLTRKKNLAHSSLSPGKTIRMDFFLINDSFYFVDFPGYGYAKHSYQKREKLAKMILWYLMYSEIKNRLVILVIDVKVGLTPYDADMLKTFHEHHINYIIVANKMDNLRMGQKEKQIINLQQEYPNSEVIPYSSKQKYQGFELIRRISSYIS
ncbi:MAG: ribosome biogenesis GTP-binding protein YihA/YsxC [Candidatus Curtissbacteria bacterium]|nr:ribosome biogenesis GTP-binding protein YihA/YsxC [Candidatus Curtissbacteria bacterium]